MKKSDMTLLIISVTEIWKRSRFKSLYKDKFNKKIKDSITLQGQI